MSVGEMEPPGAVWGDPTVLRSPQRVFEGRKADFPQATHVDEPDEGVEP